VEFTCFQYFVGWHQISALSHVRVRDWIGTETAAELDIKLALDLTGAIEPCLVPHHRGRDIIGADCRLNTR
jgi:hypothetical protein